MHYLHQSLSREEAKPKAMEAGKAHGLIKLKRRPRSHDEAEPALALRMLSDRVKTLILDGYLENDATLQVSWCCGCAVKSLVAFRPPAGDEMPWRSKSV